MSVRYLGDGKTPAVPTKSDCIGCYNDAYNHGLGGASECWSFRDAYMVDMLDISVNQPPPYDRAATTRRPNCYRAQRMCRVSPDSLTKDGYWR